MAFPAFRLSRRGAVLWIRQGIARAEKVQDEMQFELVSLNTVMNPDPKLGGLSFAEGERDIPFAIRRIYYIFQAEKGAHRGFHAHKKNWQLLFCPYGAIDIILFDGEESCTVSLDEPSKGLILYPGLWREMVWKKDDSVLCVAASEYYDPDEYIRDYDEYLQYVKQKKGGIRE